MVSRSKSYHNTIKEETKSTVARFSIQEIDYTLGE